MSQYFITGIGTGVGKTFATCAITHQSCVQYRAIKPVLSGFEMAEAEQSDAGQLLLAQGEEISVEKLDAISPYRFKAPLSPHLAAARENTAIDPQALIGFCRQQKQAYPNLLIEGVGGVMVPITADWLVLDWVKALELPIILISSSYLGAISHTLLSLEALKTAGLPVALVIISQAEDCVGMEETAHSIRPFLPSGTRLQLLPRQSHWKNAPDLLSSLS